MTENTAQSRAVQERMAERSDANRPVTRFGRSGRRKTPAVVQRAPLSEASRAAAQAASRRYGAGGTSRFDRDRGPAL
jgi:hypothetical protein